MQSVFLLIYDCYAYISLIPNLTLLVKKQWLLAISKQNVRQLMHYCYELNWQLNSAFKGCLSHPLATDFLRFLRSPHFFLNWLESSRRSHRWTIWSRTFYSLRNVLKINEAAKTAEDRKWCKWRSWISLELIQGYRKKLGSLPDSSSWWI